MAEKEQEVLALLERVFLRLGSAETDEQLEITISKFLVPVILRLSDASKVVQQKVLELLAHVSKRAKNRSAIQLPVSDLLDQLLETHSSPFIYNFLVIYVKMGFVRLSPSNQIELLPRLIQCLKGKSLNQQNIILQLLMNSLTNMKFSSNVQDTQCHFLFTLPNDLQEMILTAMQNFLFLPYNISQEFGEVQSNSTLPAPPPGMSESSLRSLIGEVPLRSDDVEKIKLSIVQIVGSGKFRSQDVSCHLVVASSDPRHMVSDAAKVKMKQLVSLNDWNNLKVIKKLYEIFLGTTPAERNVKPTDKKMPCSVQLRTEIMNIFVKCNEASQHFPATIQVVYDSLFSTNTNTRLKLLAVQFVHQLCLFSSQPCFDVMGPMLNSAMLKVIQNEDEDTKIKGQVYLAIGKIGKRKPEIVTKNFSLVQNLFQALSESREEITSSVQECLTMLAPGFRNLDPEKLLQLESILMQYIESESVASRIVSVRYADLVFPPKHLLSRYALLLACGDSKEDVVNEALKSLNDETLDLPSFVDFIQFIHSKANCKPSAGSMKSLPFKKASFVEILKYARRCLQKDVSSFNSLLNPSDLKSPHIGKYAATLKSSNIIELYVDLLKQFLTVHIESSILHSLLEVVAVSKDFLNYELLSDETWLKEVMFGTAEESSKYAAELFSMVITQNKSFQELQSVIRDLITDLYVKNLEKQRGSLFCFGFVMNKVMMNMKQRSEKPDIPTEYKTLFEKAISFIANTLKDSKQLTLSLAAYCCLSELARCGWCAFIPEVEEDNDQGVNKRSFIQLLIEKVQSSKGHQKERESVVLCLSMMCVGEKDLRHKKLIIDGLMQTAEAKKYELHCVIGEALVVVGQGSKSSANKDKWTSLEEDATPALGESCGDMGLILDAILTKYLKSSNPHIRQAGCIWLLTLVKKVGEWPLVQDQILKVQAAFISLLGENDDLMQDVVSRGLAAVYEKGNEEVKKELVSCLIDSLMGNRKRKLDVSENTTNVFEEGSLGKTPEGQNISTYKELCSIANDLNQPDLIYKFMNLANHNASWDLKRGAAHGFSTIASQASEQLSPFLDKILPKLYRFQFDPNPRVRGAMQEIWSALVIDQDKMLSKYLKEILVDLEHSLTNPQWRVRESSCLALNDLVRSHYLHGAEDILPDIWKTLFRVRDDIKESVRKAADLALHSLSKTTIRMCDASSSKSSSSQKTTSLVIPVLLDLGLSSNVDEVRSISLSTLMKMSKSSGELLKPHITTLVIALLESISTLEPQMLNYLSLHAASNQSTLDMIDKARISSYKSSPMMEVINQCVQLTDGDAVASLLPKLSDLLKSSIGLGTKICASSVLISLIQKHPQDVSLFSGKLLAVLFAGLGNKNASLRKSYSLAIGHVVKVSKDSSVTNLINKLQNCYFEKEDEIVRETCGTVIHSINLVCSDIIKRHSSSILPFVFFGMHESKSPEMSNPSSVSSNWEEVWQEGTPCTEVGLKMYSDEIVVIMQRSLESPSWTIRAQGARAMLTFIEKMAADLSNNHAKAIMISLLTALPGRTWEGKEILLRVLSVLCINCKQTNFFMETDLKLCDIIEAVFKECRKDNLKYKIKAVTCVTVIIETFETQDFPSLWELVGPIIKKKNSRKEEDDNDIDIATIQEAFKVSFDALCRCWPSNQEMQKTFQEEMCKIFTDNIGCHGWQIEVALLRSMHKFAERWFIFNGESHIVDYKSLITSLLSSLIPKFCQFLGNSKISTLRTETISTLELIFNKLAECKGLNVVNQGQYKDELVAKLKDISLNDALLDLKNRAHALLQLISQ